ncbi:MAG: uroporphyrinogen-III C-methyltransferase [Acidobacteria bacterium]|nr:MAG: uroporphyrinogen-III C-methyltransferase [Acidobacteriota bacterium]
MEPRSGRRRFLARPWVSRREIDDDSGDPLGVALPARRPGPKRVILLEDLTWQLSNWQLGGGERVSWGFPIFVNLQGVPVVVIGAGAVAERKVSALLEAGARVTVVAPDATPAIDSWAADGRLALKRRRYEAGDLRGARLAYAATGDDEVNRGVRLEALREGAWLNAVDQPDLCDFISPAVVRRGDLTLAISTNGRAPGLAKRIREQLEGHFHEEYGAVVEQAAAERDRLRAGPSATAGGASADPATAVEGAGSSLPAAGRQGRVFLVGAGPGDIDLITVKGLKLLQAADVVVYDALVDKRVLECCRRGACLHYVGKRDKRHTKPQAEINELLIQEARAGRLVVRLKGGDPFIFGRGGEEAEALAAAGVAFEVVPGVSAGIGVPAYAGIPLTHRDFTSELVFVTGHECGNGRQPVDWKRYAAGSASIVIFMGLHSLPEVARQLLAHGRDPECPVAVIENGTTAEQRTLVAPLARVAEQVSAAGVQPPALVVIGEVVRLRDKIAWRREQQGSLVEGAI